jgi:group I intron endonuclease
LPFTISVRNKISGKCYIGESKEKDPYTRWKVHQQTIAKGTGCPALQDAVRKYGIENFEFTILIFCFDEDRFYYEKEYIKRYNSQVPNGYNITPGGEGGGFYGKKHTKESMQKMVQSMRKYYDDPAWIAQLSARTKEQMKNTDISSIVRNSENFRKAVEEGRVGGGLFRNKMTKEECEKINKRVSESLKKYYSKNDGNKSNIEKRRESMAKATGVRVSQYSKDNIFIASYVSMNEAFRATKTDSSNIKRVLDHPTRTANGFRWRTRND